MIGRLKFGAIQSQRALVVKVVELILQRIKR